MAGERLDAEEVRRAMADWPEPARRLGIAARRRVLDLAPALAETIAFGSLCYFKPGLPYGVIGGNVCLLAVKGAELRLAFLHGASLPDSEGLLRGSAKAKRELPLRDEAELHHPAVAALILAAVAHAPARAEDREPEAKTRPRG